MQASPVQLWVHLGLALILGASVFATPEEQALSQDNQQAIIAQWSGLWRVIGDPRAKHSYLRLESDGVATSDIHDGAVGTWTVEGGLQMRALQVNFGDGWAYRILPVAEGWGLAITPPTGDPVIAQVQRVGQLRTRFLGAWKITNPASGATFYRVLYDNGGAFTSRQPDRADFWWIAKGAAHIRQPGGTFALLHPAREEAGWRYTLFDKGSGDPVTLVAEKVPDAEPRLAGLWEIVEPAGGGFVRLEPTGEASQTGNFTRQGRWEVFNDEARILWYEGGRAVLAPDSETGHRLWLWPEEHATTGAPTSDLRLLKRGM